GTISLVRARTNSLNSGPGGPILSRRRRLTDFESASMLSCHRRRGQEIFEKNEEEYDDQENCHGWDDVVRFWLSELGSKQDVHGHGQRRALWSQARQGWRSG